MNRRMERVNSTLRTAVSKVLASHVRDPRLYSLVSVTQVDTSPDLKSSIVYISVLGDEADKRKAMQALRSASGFIRQRMKPDLYMKSVPSLTFHLDESIERSAEIMQVIADATADLPPEDTGSR